MLFVNQSIRKNQKVEILFPAWYRHNIAYVVFSIIVVHWHFRVLDKYAQTGPMVLCTSATYRIISWSVILLFYRNNRQHKIYCCKPKKNAPVKANIFK